MSIPRPDPSETISAAFMDISGPTPAGLEGAAPCIGIRAMTTYPEDVAGRRVIILLAQKDIPNLVKELLARGPEPKREEEPS